MTEKIYRAAKAEEVLTLAGLCAAAYLEALWVKTDVQRMTAFWRKAAVHTQTANPAAQRSKNLDTDEGSNLRAD